TREELELLIDEFDKGAYETTPLGNYKDYNLFRHDGEIYGVPKNRSADLNLEHERQRPGVIKGRTRSEVEESIGKMLEKVPVEFAGWLPIFKYSGNCGSH